eukprot:258334_1
MADVESVDREPLNGYLIEIEEGTQTNGQILVLAISGLITWIFCSIFAWILSGYMTRYKKRLSNILILATIGVISFSWLDGFIAFAFSTNVFIKDAQYAMQYQCSRSLHITALCYGLYRYSLYVFYLIRIRNFFRGTAHEFRKQKFIAACLVITIIAFCLISVLVFYITPTIINTNRYMICSGQLNEELREEILIFLIFDVFISLYLTWLFVIKSRALLALENANQGAIVHEPDETDDEEEPLTNANYGVDNANMSTTYFIDTENGGLNSKSVRKLMLRCIYFGMLAMMTTWVHLALRFVNFANIHCVETFVNCLCVVMSFDITSDGYFNLFCWCQSNMGHRHGYGRNVRINARNKDAVNPQQQHGQKQQLSTVPPNNE